MNSRDAYTESFAERGSQYDQAMRQVPDSRREEFLVVINELPDLTDGLVLDVPAGGRYLQQYLPPEYRYLSYEPVDSFEGEEQTDPERMLIPFPQDSNVVDAVVSVAGVHHFKNKEPLFREMARVAKPEGHLILADVHRQSKVAAFLDGYIDANNSTGHHGYYLGEHTLLELENSGWHVLSAQRNHYHWRFKSEHQMSEFCHLLFDIRHSDVSQTSIKIAEDLGVDQLDDGSVGMCWELFVIKAQKSLTS